MPVSERRLRRRNRRGGDMNIFDEPQVLEAPEQDDEPDGNPAPEKKKLSVTAAAAIVGAVVLASVGALALTRHPRTTTAAQPFGPAAAQQQGSQQEQSGPGGPDGRPDTLATAASVIGIGESDLVTSLQNGSSMAEAARAHGVDPQKVVDALVRAEKSRLAQAVSSGVLTQAQADQISSGIVARVADRVNGTGSGGPGGGPGGPGFGPPP